MLCILQFVCFPSDADYNLMLNRHLIYTEIERLKITSKKKKCNLKYNISTLL